MSLVVLFAFPALAAESSDGGFAWTMAEIEAKGFPSFDSSAMACSDAAEAFADFDSFDNFVGAFHFVEGAPVDVAGAAGDNFDLK